MATTKKPPLGVLVCAVFLRLVLSAHMTVDLSTGNHTTTGAGLQWLSEPNQTSSTSGSCDKQGLLKITFDTKNRNLARLDMEFHNPTKFSFDVSDSSSADGGGVEEGTKRRKPEVFTYNKELIVGSKDRTMYRGDFVLATGSSPHTYLTLNVSHNIASAVREDSSFLYYNSFRLFTLRGRNRTNRIAFLGLNRVVSNNAYEKGSVGSGLCSVRLTWSKNVHVA